MTTLSVVVSTALVAPVFVGVPVAPAHHRLEERVIHQYVPANAFQSINVYRAGVIKLVGTAEAAPEVEMQSLEEAFASWADESLEMAEEAWQADLSRAREQ